MRKIGLVLFLFILGSTNMACAQEASRFAIVTDAENGIVSPGQKLLVKVSWPGYAIESASIKYSIGEGRALIDFPINNNTIELIVPELNSDLFVLSATAKTFEGLRREASLELTLSKSMYTNLLAEPSSFNLQDRAPRFVTIRARDARGELHDVTSSAELQITSSDPKVVIFDEMLQASWPGKANLVAVYKNVKLEIPVKVTGIPIGVKLVTTQTEPVIIRQQQKPIVFAILSSFGFNPESVNPQTIRIKSKYPPFEETQPLPYSNGSLATFEDFNNDGVMDLLVQVSPENFDLTQETKTFSISFLAGGTFFTGEVMVQVKDQN